jgi:hypothetical protein
MMDIENVIEIEVDTSSESSISTKIEKVGPAGLSAYQIAVKDGFVGTEEEWLLSLKGDKGNKGDTGERGPAGPVGPAGPQGERGLTGETGPKGETGPAGRDGYLQYTAGENITIENNVISAEVPEIDLSNYYDKDEVNGITGSLNNLDTEDKSNLVNAINELANASGGNNLPFYSVELKTTAFNNFSNRYNFSTNDREKFSNIITDAYSKGYNSICIFVISKDSNSPSFMVTTSSQSSGNIQAKNSTLQFFSLDTNQLWTPGNGLARAITRLLLLSISWNNDIATVTSGYIMGATAMLLATNNEVSYIPTTNYNPSTKLYTDKTHYENMAGYDATKTQVLKNINGTLTWVDE